MIRHLYNVASFTGNQSNFLHKFNLTTYVYCLSNKDKMLTRHKNKTKKPRDDMLKGCPDKKTGQKKLVDFKTDKTKWKIFFLSRTYLQSKNTVSNQNHVSIYRGSYTTSRNKYRKTWASRCCTEFHLVRENT